MYIALVGIVIIGWKKQLKVVFEGVYNANQWSWLVMYSDDKEMWLEYFQFDQVAEQLSGSIMPAHVCFTGHVETDWNLA
jgi:hypothetical protein